MKYDSNKKTAQDDSSESIELSKENVPDLIGEIPPALIRWGLAAIIAIFLALAVALCMIEYPYSHGESILEHLIR